MDGTDVSLKLVTLLALSLNLWSNGESIYRRQKETHEHEPARHGMAIGMEQQLFPFMNSCHERVCVLQ